VKTYDYVIVGAGSAGCVLAHRLSAHSGNTVCLLEAGPSGKSIFIQMPAALTFPIESKTYNWGYASAPEPHLDGRRIGQARGRCLGGSSAINGMVFVRGDPRDYDQWNRFGIADWDFGNCLPYFKRLESFEHGRDPNRGGDGPLSVVRSRAAHVFYERFIQAGEQFGLPRAEDYNSRRQEGVHVTQATIRNGVRSSTAEAYLFPAMHRDNLTVETGCFVERILFDRTTATGVDCIIKGERRTVSAAKEVILSAGAIGSPHLLMLSGLGDADRLAEHGVPLVAHLPGVGENLQDHVVAPIRYRSDKPVSVNRQLGMLGRARLGLEWLLLKRGLGASNFFETGAFFDGGSGSDYFNLQHEFLPFLADFQDGKVKLGDGFQYFVSQMRPYCRGHIRLTSPDPRTHPAIRFNYLADRRDLREMLDGIRMTREIARQAAWDEFRSEEIEPGPAVETDNELERWFRSAANTEHHPVGTCRMGNDEMAVTDGAGRVRGIENLRLVDGSILPLIPSANVNAPIIMVAEKIADRILELPPLPAETLG